MADQSVNDTASIINQFLTEFLTAIPEPKSSPVPPSKAGPKQLFRAISTFVPESEREMAINAGDIVIVEEQGEDGWWLGLCAGKRSV